MTESRADLSLLGSYGSLFISTIQTLGVGRVAATASLLCEADISR